MNTPKPILIVYAKTAAAGSKLMKTILDDALIDIKEEYHTIYVMDMKPSEPQEIDFKLLSPNQAEEFNLAKVTRHIKNKLKKSGHTEFIIN